MNQEARWMDTKEVATRTRKALKVAFPATKFSVRMSRYSMGSSVYIEWRDGPSVAQVAEVYAPLNFYRFDGMEDLASTADARMIDGERVRASCSFSTRRSHSQAAVQRAIQAARDANHAGVDADLLTIGGGEEWGYYLQTSEPNQMDHWSAWSVANRALDAGSDYATAPEVFQVQPDPEAEAREAAQQAASFDAIKTREAAIRADIDQIQAAFRGKVEAYQMAPGQYVIHQRLAVPASGARLAEGTLTELLELAGDISGLLAPLRKAKPRLQVWSDGSVMLTPDLWTTPAGRVLN